MTATTSSKKLSYFGTRFKNNISQNKRNLIVHCVLELLGLPVIAVVTLIFAWLDENKLDRSTEIAIEGGCTAFLAISVFVIIICLFLGMTFALSYFKYLYKKSIVDMNYALPLSGTQRFLADYLSGLACYMIPAVSAIILSIGIVGVGTPFISALSEFWDIFPEIFKYIIIALITMLLFYTLCVLAITFCGNTFEAIFSIFAFNLLIPASIACIWFALCESTPFGIGFESIITNNIFTSTSPIGAVFFTGLVESSLYNADSYASSLFTRWIIFTLFATAIYFIIAFLLYRKRKAEDVSKPYVYKTAFYAIMVLTVFCILSLFLTADGFLMAGIVLCGIIWFIMEVITRRGFRKFWQAGIGFVGAVASVLLICYIFDISNAMGLAKKVPSSITVESVVLDFDKYGGFEETFIKDKEVIKEAVKLHKEIVDRHFNPDDYDYETISDKSDMISTDTFLTLQYFTYTGTSIMREYVVPSSMTGDLMKAVLLSDEYAKQTSERIRRNYSYMFDDIYKYNQSYDERTVSLDYKNKVGSYFSVEVKGDVIENLVDAYYNDLMAMTEDDLLNADYYGTFDYDFFILSTFENTISVLEDAGLKIGNVDIVRRNSSDRIYYIPYPTFGTRAEKIFESDDDDKYNRNRIMYDSYDDDEEFSYADSLTCVDTGHIYVGTDNYARYDDEAMVLVKRCTAVVIDEKPIAMFKVDGHILFLLDRDDNKELLDKFISIEGGKISFSTGSLDENGWD